MIQNIILDIDNTLLHAIPNCSFSQYLIKRWTKHKQLVAQSTHFTFFLRPYLQTFLQWLFDNFEVGIFTAGNEPYAADVVSKVIQPLLRRDQQTKLHFIFNKTHYDECFTQFGTTKDLRYVESKISHFQRQHTLIIDDLDQVFETNIDNCIPCPAFFISIKQEEKHKFNQQALFDSFLSTVQIYLLDLKRPFLENLRDSPFTMYDMLDSDGEIF